MQGIEDPDIDRPGSRQDLGHVRHTAVCLRDVPQAVPDLPPSEMKSLYGSITTRPVLEAAKFASVISSL